MKSNDFPDNYEIEDEDLAAIETLAPLNTPKSQISSFTRGNNRKILLPYNKLSERPKHLTLKSPISVFSQRSESEPPMRKIQIKLTETRKSEPISKTPPTSSDMNDNPRIKYENYIFHGNIVNNCYYSGIGYGKGGIQKDLQ